MQKKLYTRVSFNDSNHRVFSILLALFISLSNYATQAESIQSVQSQTEEILAKESSATKKIVYLVSDTRIPFWSIMARGIQSKADALNYSLAIYSANNSAKKELEFTVKAIKDKVSGIIVSPTNSSACSTILKLAKSAGIPVVIADIGTDSGDYLSYISSNNYDGAYLIGKILASQLKSKGWDMGRVGIIGIPQKRLNGQARTAGFMLAMTQANIKGAGIEQQSTFSEQETYNLSKKLIDNTPNLRALWLQGSNRYTGALNAIRDANKSDDILLVTFDAEPEFLDLIPKRILVGSAMQQPYLMGQKAVETLNHYFNGKEIKQNQQLPVLAISPENIQRQLELIKLNVLGIE